MASRDVVDQADNLSSRPDAILGIAVDEDLASSLAADEGSDFRELSCGALFLDLQSVLGDLVPEEAGGIPPASED